MKPTAVLAVLVAALSAAACATGTYASDSGHTAHGDGGILKKDDDASAPKPPPAGDDGGTVLPPDDDAGGGPTCNGTVCGTNCVDTTSDPQNCGGCGVVCDPSATCTSGQCTSTQTSNEPPQGTCDHSLCSSGTSLEEGCDTQGCTVVICDPSYLGDDFCCDTQWDSTCIDEVNTYCAPYSCN